MRAQTIRRIDQWAGVPICAGLTLVRRLFGWAVEFTADAPEPPRKILILKMIEQGSTVLAFDALHRAVDKVGRENVFFCAFQENREVLDLMALIPPENVLTLRAKRFDLFAVDALKVLSKIRRLGIDAVVDFEFFARGSAIFSFLTGARRRVGLHRFASEGPYRGDLMTHRVQYPEHLHTARYFSLLIESIDQDPSETPLPKIPAPSILHPVPRFSPSEEERRQVQSKLHSRFAHGKQPAGPLVLLNPNASDLLPLRKWPTERYIELGQRLLQGRPDLAIAITGAPDEEEAARKIAEAIGPSSHVVSMAGQTTLRELFVLYTLADILVTNDSGPGHFASITGIHSITLFGPETPLLYGPLGEGHEVLASGLACSPCVNVFNHRFSPCRNNRCMQAITVPMALERVEHALTDRKRP